MDAAVVDQFSGGFGTIDDLLKEDNEVNEEIENQVVGIEDEDER
jgi:hypothetical protein